MTGETTEIRGAGMDSPESDKDVPKSADKDTNRRPMIKLIDGDDDSHSETPDTLKAKHMQEEVGQLPKNCSTVVPRSCGSRESPAAACRLARTER